MTKKRKPAKKKTKKAAKPKKPRKAEIKGAKVSKEQGTAEQVLESIPIIGGIFKAVKNTPAFKERLKEVNAEIEENLKKQPTKKKPVVDFSYRVRSIKGGAGGDRSKPMPSRKVEPKVKRVVPREPRRKFLVDIFEEKTGIRIVAELPGVKEKDIKVSVKNRVLTITTDSMKRRVMLPYPVKPGIKKSYKNNILELRLEKK